MQKSKAKKLIWLVILVCLATGVLLSSNYVEASVACKKYKEHKKFKSEENKKIYFKIKWIKNHDRKAYDYYRAICEPFKFDPYQFKGNLNAICHDYYIYEEYDDYRYYKKQCHKNDSDDEEIVEPEPEAELQ